MKTINYQFFIYFFLTIIYGVTSIDNKSTASKHQTNSPLDKCNLNILFSSLNSTKDCQRLAIDSTVSYPELSNENSFAYLCTGIVQGAQKIGQLCIENPSTNLMIQKSITEFHDEIKKLSFNKTISEFCTSMGESISNSSYTETIKNGTGIIELNKGLHQYCDMMCGIINKPIKPVCSALLWLNKLLADTVTLVKTIPKKTESAQSLPAPDNSSVAKVAEQQKKEDQASSKTDDSHSHVKLSQDDSKKKLEESSNADKKVLKSELEKDLTAKKSGDNTSEGVPKKKDKDISETVPKKKDENMSETVPKKKDEVTPKTQSEVEGGMQAEPPERNQGPGSENDETQGLDPNQSNGAGIEETDSHQSYVSSPQEDETQGLEDKIQNPNEAEDENDGDDVKMPADRDGKVEIDSPKTGDSLDVNDQTLPGPPEPPQHFFAYFMAISLICLVCYIGYHKKHKIMAIVFEGRKSRGGRGRRRPNTANYRKLDCTLEEAVTSQCNSNVTHVIY